jgi:hypothetical protein
MAGSLGCARGLGGCGRQPPEGGAVSAPEIERHCDRRDLQETILAGLRSAGLSPDSPSVDDLAPVDHFHTRGEATLELLRWGALRSDMAVLDVGGWLGGSARLRSEQRPNARLPDGDEPGVAERMTQRETLRAELVLVLTAQQHAEDRGHLVEAFVPLICSVARIYRDKRR